MQNLPLCRVRFIKRTFVLAKLSPQSLRQKSFKYLTSAPLRIFRLHRPCPQKSKKYKTPLPSEILEPSAKPILFNLGRQGSKEARHTSLPQNNYETHVIIQRPAFQIPR